MTKQYVETLQFSSKNFATNLNSLFLKVSENTVKESKQPLIYLINYVSEPPVSLLIENMHFSSIQTILDDSSNLERFNENSHPKNMVFFVENVPDIISIILDSVKGHPFDVLTPPRDHFLYCSNATGDNDGPSAQQVLERGVHGHCVKIGGENPESKNFNSISLPPLIIHDFELEHGSILSQELYLATRELYSHNIWSSKNYLIFFVCDSTNSRKFCIEGSSRNDCDQFDDTSVAFKFFWRFFKGLKSVICFTEVCFAHNPFTGEIVHFTGLRDEQYFDFSWPDLNGGYFQILVPTLNSEFGGSAFDFWQTFWIEVLTQIAGTVEKERNCSFETARNSYIFEIGDFKQAQQFGIDIVVEVEGLIVGETLFSQYEFTTSMESYHMCLAVPRAGLVPQPLAIFYSFSTIIWTLILITILTFVCVLYLFLKLQVNVFQSYYDETTIQSFQTESAIFTVYAYFLCGCPPRLLLGKLLTGKILFTIFSFAAIILVTAFQDSMYRMLSNYVKYPDVDTLEEFSRTEWAIQMPRSTLNRYSKFFENVPFFQGQAKGLVDTYLVLRSLLNEAVESSGLYLLPIYYKNLNESLIDPYIFNRSLEIENFISTAFESDAFLLTIPHVVLSAKNIELQSFLIATSWFEMHLVEECLNSYLLAFRFPKNNFFYEDFNRKVVQILETGHLKNMMDERFKSKFTLDLRPAPAISEEQPLRPFTLNDLAFAFIALTIGLTISFFVFIAELSIDLNGGKNTLVQKYSKYIDATKTVFLHGLRKFLTRCLILTKF